MTSGEHTATIASLCNSVH